MPRRRSAQDPPDAYASSIYSTTTFASCSAQHSQLKLQSIAPIGLPRNGSRARVHHYGQPGSARIEDSVLRGAHHHVQGHHHALDYVSIRADSSVVDNTSIFSSPSKRVAQLGSTPTNRSSKPLVDGRSPRHQILTLQQASRLPNGDSIAFDPFTESSCYAWLVDDPATTPVARQNRQEPLNLDQFREWMASKFPKVMVAFETLQMLHPHPRPHRARAPRRDYDAAPRREVSIPRSTVQNPSDPETDGSASDTEESSESRGFAGVDESRQQLVQQKWEAQRQAWSVLFEHARLVSVPPGDTFVTQGETPAREVFFVLSGQCKLLFHPQFLDSLVQARSDGTQAPSPAAVSDVSDLDSQLNILLAMRRLNLPTLTKENDTAAVDNTVSPLRILRSGEYFGVEACTFQFARHVVSAVSQGALQRNEIGIATQACLHVLSVPFQAILKMREIIVHTKGTSPRIRQDKPPTPDTAKSLLAPRRRACVARIPHPVKAPAEKAMLTSPLSEQLPGYHFHEEDVEYLRHTFIFQSMQLSHLQYLATQLRLIRVPKHEYLFTTGQEVFVYLVKSGQLRVFSPEQVRLHTSDDDGHELRETADSVRDASGEHIEASIQRTTMETRHVELEILQHHDSVGLMEASLLQPAFSNCCIAASSDVRVYVLPPVALFTVLAFESTASQHVVENLLQHHSWYKARKSTALNHHNKQTEFHLSLSAQRRSPITCSRCGWGGHTSTSSLCVRATSLKSAFVQHLIGKDLPQLPPVSPQKPSVGTRADRVSQLRLAHRTGSGAVGPLDNAPPTLAQGARSGSVVFSRAGGEFYTHCTVGSSLPDLDGLVALFRFRDSNEDDTTPASTETSEVVKALGRLDAALEESESAAPTASLALRPHSQQQQRRRPVDLHQNQRRSVFDLRGETLRVVARIGTAATAYNPRARVAAIDK